MVKSFRKFFECDKCSNRTFKLAYSFYLDFHPVNFSEDLIYDKVKEEYYLCTKCGKAFTKKEINEGLKLIKNKYKNS